MGSLYERGPSSKWPALYESTAFEQLRELVLQAGQAYLRARGDARADALDVAVWASVYLGERRLARINLDETFGPVRSH